MDLNLTVGFDEKIITFCRGNDFRTYVRNVINDEIFLRDLIGQLKLSNAIEEKLNSKLPADVKRQLESILPYHLRNEIERILPQMMEQKFNSYVLTQFPQQVTKEINSQIPSYLNNNYQMQQILETHKAQLNTLLKNSVSEILDRIVSDPKYQEITNAHIAVIDANGAAEIRKIAENSSKQLAQNQAAFDGDLVKMKSNISSELSSMKNRIDSDMSELRNGLNSLTTLKTDMVKMKSKHSEEIRKLWMFEGALLVLMAVGGLALIGTR